VKGEKIVEVTGCLSTDEVIIAGATEAIRSFDYKILRAFPDPGSPLGRPLP
jgi:hypothetical protein